LETLNKLKSQVDFNNKVFSFPTGDAAIYAILKQNPPMYNSIFEGSSKTSQNQMINYIQDNNIKFAILNINNVVIQDGVPDYIRQPVLFKYLINNYLPFDKTKNHLLLKKTDKSDFFNSSILNNTLDYKNYLTKVYLNKIPYSEGIYKYKFFKSKDLLISRENTDEINNYLLNNNLSSKGKVFVLIPSVNLLPNYFNYLKIETKEGFISTIYYNSCQLDRPCIINLSNVPLFYENRMINKITTDDMFTGQIKIYNLENLNNLW
jgi:hypothetical protein